MADDVVIVDRGRVVAAGPLDELQQSFRRLRLVFDGPAPKPDFAAPGVIKIRPDDRVLEVVARLEAGASQDDPLLREARALGAVSMETAPMTLKEIFLETVRAEG